MAHKLSELRAKMSSEQIARVEARVANIEAQLHLAELRKARELTQKQLAEVLDVAQSEVSKIEHRADMYVSTLRRFIEATGGTLRIVADYDGEVVEIAQFAAP